MGLVETRLVEAIKAKASQAGFLADFGEEPGGVGGGGSGQGGSLWDSAAAAIARQSTQSTRRAGGVGRRGPGQERAARLSAANVQQLLRPTGDDLRVTPMQRGSGLFLLEANREHTFSLARMPARPGATAKVPPCSHRVVLFRAGAHQVRHR